MRGDATIAPARDARTNRGASRDLKGGTAVSPRAARPAPALRSAEDIEGIRAAGAIVAGALDAARAACTEGASTAAIDRAVHAWILAAGAEPVFLGYRGSCEGQGGARPPFPAASCISVNEELVHGVPGARALMRGDVVSIDAGVRSAGWCADSAITVCVGDADATTSRMVAVAERMLDEAIARIRPGVRWSSIAEAMETLATDSGFAVAVDFVGHGIGRDLHEPPQVPCSLYSSFLEHGDFTLRPGMVLAIEPMIVDERPVRNERGELRNPRVTLAADGWTVVLDSGARSCHVEHTVAVTRDGADILSAFPRIHPHPARDARIAC